MNQRYQAPRRDEDHHPLLSGSELALVAITAGLIAFVVLAITGVAVAIALFGDGSSWPHGAIGWLHALGGIVTGQPARGYPNANLPPNALVYALIAMCEMLAAVITVWCARVLRTGSRNTGMATRSEAAAALGLRELRKARSIIRPDLYSRKARR